MSPTAPSADRYSRKSRALVRSALQESEACMWTNQTEAFVNLAVVLTGAWLTGTGPAVLRAAR